MRRSIPSRRASRWMRWRRSWTNLTPATHTSTNRTKREAAMRGERRVWETFVRNPEQLKEGVPIPLFLVDLTPGIRKYGLHHAVVVIDRRPDAFPEGETLWVRTVVGVRLSSPYAMQIGRKLPSELPGAGSQAPFAPLPYPCLHNPPHLLH